MAMIHTTRPVPRVLQALMLRPFALLWAGQTISRLGDQMFRVALAWYVLQLTGSAAAMGSLLLLTTLPLLLLLPLGGVLSDRLPRRRVMLLSDLGRGVVVISLALIAWTGHVEMAHLYALAFIFGTIDAFFQPAYNAFVPQVVEESLRFSANSMTLLSGQFSMIVGPLLGAWFISWGSAATAFQCNGVSFLFAALLLWLVRDPSIPNEQPETAASFFAELKEGVAYIASISWLWVTITIFALVVVAASAPVAVGLPLLVRERFADDVGQLGALYTAAAVGAVVSALAMGRITTLRRRGLLAYGTTALSGLGILGLGLTTSFPVALLCAAADGVGVAVFSLVWTNTIQSMVPERLQGRVNSVDMLGSYCLLPFGYALFGVFADQVGAATIFRVGGIMTLVLVIIGLLIPAVRRLD